MDAALKLHEPANGPLENILSLPGLGALQATLNLAGPRAAEQLQLSLQAGALKGHAQGSLNLIELSADLSFCFRRGGHVAAARFGVGAGRAAWALARQRPIAERARGIWRSRELRVPGQLQAAALTADIAADGGKADLHALIQGLKIPGSQPDCWRRIR